MVTTPRRNFLGSKKLSITGRSCFRPQKVWLRVGPVWQTRLAQRGLRRTSHPTISCVWCTKCDALASRRSWPLVSSRWLRCERRGRCRPGPPVRTATCMCPSRVPKWGRGDSPVAVPWCTIRYHLTWPSCRCPRSLAASGDTCLLGLPRRTAFTRRRVMLDFVLDSCDVRCDFYFYRYDWGVTVPITHVFLFSDEGW